MVIADIKIKVESTIIVPAIVFQNFVYDSERIIIPIKKVNEDNIIIIVESI